MKRSTKITLITIATLLTLVLLIYPAYARKNCSDWAMRHGTLRKNGELYVITGNDEANRPLTLKYSEHFSACMNSRFGLNN